MKNFFKQRHNRLFYITATSQLLVVIQMVLALFGYGDLITEMLKDKILATVDAVLVLCGTLGVFVDHKNKDE